MDYKIMGNNIRQARKSINMTQEELAEYINLSTVFISLIETGARKPSLETVYKISMVLKVPVDDLLKGSAIIRETGKLEELSLLLNDRTDGEINLVTNVTRELLKNIKKGKVIDSH